MSVAGSACVMGASTDQDVGCTFDSKEAAERKLSVTTGPARNYLRIIGIVMAFFAKGDCVFQTIGFSQ